MDLEEINCSLNNLFLGGLLFLGLEEPRALRGEVSWIHYSPRRETLLVRVCYLAQGNAGYESGWQRLVDHSYIFKFKMKKRHLVDSLLDLEGVDQGSIIIPDDRQEIKQEIELFTVDNPWQESGLDNFNPTTH